MILTRTLGRSGLTISAQGLGCMGMSEFYGPTDEAESVATIHRAIDLGITLLDTADMYGPYVNEELVGRAIKGMRDRVQIATKFGIMRDPDDPTKRGVNGRPAETLRRAQATHPIAAVQSEYSLWTRDPEDEVLAVCRELGIGFVAYSPLGRGFLTGRFRSIDDLPDDDYRRNSPRFQGENFRKNLDVVERIEAMAREKGCTSSQLALAWVMAQGEFIVPIPGYQTPPLSGRERGGFGCRVDA